MKTLLWGWWKYISWKNGINLGDGSFGVLKETKKSSASSASPPEKWHFLGTSWKYCWPHYLEKEDDTYLSYIKPCMWPCIISFTKQIYFLTLEASSWVSLSVNFWRIVIYPEDLGRKSDTYPGCRSWQVCCMITERSSTPPIHEKNGILFFCFSSKNRGLQ